MSDACINTQGINNVSNLSEDPDTKGFDLQAGQSWIYPTNYPVRDYQYNIVEQALHKNTLVSLPTGLGKTFIAAVVMYNFYRWYPNGVIIFMAPTRPLVKQQIDACYNIMAIPQEATAELTGTKQQTSRTEIWQSKRVFFITPQVLQNDLDSVVSLGNKIKCLVFDEAHRAKGNHAYCEVIRKLLKHTKLFRVLALSATPGNSVKDILEVMKNLLISHLEFRNEESADVKPFVFERSLETVVVPLGEKLQQIKDDYMQVLEYYTRALIKYKVVNGNFSTITKGRLFMIKKEFQAKNSGSVSNYSEIMRSLSICMTLYHAYEVLIQHGLRGFLNFYEEHASKPLIRNITRIMEIMEDIRQYLGPPLNVEPLPDGTYSAIPSDTKFGHPKFYQLRDILESHFMNSDETSRVIVFFELRESVKEAHALLLQCRPKIRARIFIGQGSGVTQKSQINVVKAFREGTCNTLLSTCIGEEGLDVGDVNLIICFDISNKSPIRMIQRMGRTGRKKQGRVIVLVTEGKEQQTLKDCLIYKNNLGTFVMNSKELDHGKYNDNPKMVPSYIKPVCQKMFITINKPTLTKKSTVKDLLRNMSHGRALLLEDVEIVEIEEKLQNKFDCFWNKRNPLLYENEKPKINFSKHLEKQRAFQPCGAVKHSRQSEILVTLLQFADSKRFNIPVTQNLGKFVPQMNLIQGDIRNMFSKTATVVSSDFLISDSQNFDFDKEKDMTQTFPSEFFQEIQDYLTIQTSMEESCKICLNLFKCPKINRISNPIQITNWVQPDLSIFDNITRADLEVFGNSLSPKSAELYHSLDENNDIFDSIEFSQFENFDEISPKSPKKDNKSFSYEAPKNLGNILNSIRISKDEAPSDNQIEDEFGGSWRKKVCEAGKTVENKSFGFGELENSDVYNESVEMQKVELSKQSQNAKETNLNYDELLAFFKLSSIENLFDDEDPNKTIPYEYSPKPSPKTNIPSSPDLFGDSPDLFTSPPEKNEIIKSPESPVLCSFQKSRTPNAKRKLFEPVDDTIAKKPNLANLKLPNRSFYESKKKSPLKTNIKSTENSYEKLLLDIDDICDLSHFGLNNTTKTINLNREDKVEQSKILKNTINVEDKVEKSKICDIDISDVCDLSIFGLTKSGKIQENGVLGKESKKESVQKELSISDICDMDSFLNDPVLPESKKDAEAVNFENVATLQNKNNEDVLKKNPGKLNSTVIDLTDSDFESSPLKQKPTQTAHNKTLSQLSITQMLSLINKKDNNEVTEKENSTSSKTSKKENSTSSKTSKCSQKLPLKKKVLQVKQNVDSPRNNPVEKPKIRTPKTKKTKFNWSLISNNSDDDFEDTVTSPIFAKPRPVMATKSVKKQSSGKVAKKPKNLLSVFNNNKEVKEKTKKTVCEYIDEEAEVTDVASEDEDENEHEDCFEASFIGDETEDFNSTQMQAHYLKSVKSPRVGKFKIPDKPRYNVTNVFSQDVTHEDDTYINDSFCVNTEDIDSPDEHELSQLDILEMKLKEQKKKRKKSQETTKTKRRRIVIDDSD